MGNQNRGLLYHNIRKRIYKRRDMFPHPDTFVRNFDRYIYFVVMAAPLTNIPQLLRVWVEKDASGVSPISWFFFSWISLSWLIYGHLHKDRNILIMNAALMVMQVAIAIGALVYA